MQTSAPEYLARDLWLAAARKGAAPLDKALTVFTPNAPRLLKAVDDANRIIPLVVSTEDEDRSHDIVTQSGWDLGDYRKNPVGCVGHCWDFPVSKAVDISVMGTRLIALMQYATREESPVADTTYRLVKGAFMLGVSPGFKMRRWAYNEDRGGLDMFEQVLLEVSNCVVPDNQNALAMVKSLGHAQSSGIDLQPLRPWAERTLDLKSEPALVAWFHELLRLGGSPMKGKTINVGRVLSAALAQKITAEQPREALVKAMAEKAAVDVDSIETVLKGEAAEGLSLTALDGVVGVVGADVDEVLAAAVADVQPETPAAPPAEGTSAEAPPAADSGTPADPPAETDTSKALLAALTKNTEAQERNAALQQKTLDVQTEMLAALKAKPAEPPAPTTKGAGSDDDIDLSALTPEMLATITKDAIQAVVNDSLTSVDGRLRN